MLPLVEPVVGAALGAQLPVLLRVAVLHQLAQAVEGLLKADLLVLALVCHPEQLRDGVWFLLALRGGQRVNHAPRHRPAAMARPPPTRCLPVGGRGGGLWPGPAWKGLAGRRSSLTQSVARTAYAAESGQRGSGMVGTSANWTWGCMGDRGCRQGSICWLTAHPTTQSTLVHHRRLFKPVSPAGTAQPRGFGVESCA